MRPRPSPGIERLELGGELFLFDPVSDRLAVLNGTAGTVWLCCDGKRTVADVVTILAGEFGQEPPAVTEVVIGALHAMAAQGLLRWAD